MKFVLTETQRNSDDSFNYDVTGDFPITFRNFLKWVFDNDDSFRICFHITNKSFIECFTKYIEFERENYNGEWQTTKIKPENFYSENADKQIIKCTANGGWGQMTYFCTLEESKNEE